MESCLFCKIIQKEIPAEAVHEDEKTVVLLDIHPRAPGHVMVIPKTHCEGIFDLPQDFFAPLMGTVQKMTRVLKKALNSDAFIIGINEGQIAGQVIQHLHIHIIPRYKGDGGSSVHSVVNNPPKETLEEIAKKIKGFVQKSEPKGE